MTGAYGRWPWLALCLSACACDRTAPALPQLRPGTDGAQVVAHVGQEPIYRADVLALAAKTRLTLAPLPEGAKLGTSLPPAAESAAELQAVRAGALEQLIAQTLLARRARALHVVVLTDEVEAGYAQMTAGWPAAQLAPMLVQLDTTVPELKEALRRQILAGKVLRQEVLARVQVTEQDVQAALAEAPELLQLPEQVRLRQIVVPTEAALAEVQQGLKQKRAFADLAAAHSTAPEAAAGGDLGLLSREALPREVAQLCFSLRPHQVSKPLLLHDGIHLFWVSAKLAARPRRPEEARQLAEAKLRRAREQAAEQQYLMQLEEDAHVQRIPANLAP